MDPKGSASAHGTTRLMLPGLCIAITALCGTPVAAATPSPAPSAAPAPPGTTLGSFESRVDSTYAVSAAKKHAEGEDASLTQARAAAGLSWFLNQSIGPRSDLINQTNAVNRIPSLYTQNLGVSLPIFGHQSQQIEAINNARAQAQLAEVDVDDVRRTTLDTVRTAYVGYWQYQTAASVDQKYLAIFKKDLKLAQALVKAGFWTRAPLLDYIDVSQKTYTDLESSQSSARAQLAALEAAVDTHLNAFSPAAPLLDAGCSDDLDALAAAAAEADPTIKQIEVQIALARANLAQVPHSSIDADVTGSIGTSYDSATKYSRASLAYTLDAGTSFSMPMHGRLEERSQRKSLLDEIDSQNLLEQQRRQDLRSQVEAALEDLDAAQTALIQARTDQQARAEDLREAEVRFRTQHMDQQPLFNDVETALVNSFTADRAAVDAQALVWQKATALLLLSPDACQKDHT
jgi:outer membrane protein TolC